MSKEHWYQRPLDAVGDGCGFALISVLWLIAALSTLVGLGVATTRLGVQTTANRIHLAQGRWAAEACLAIAHKRWTETRAVDAQRVDLGQGKRCGWRIEDPTTRINVNRATPPVLRKIATFSSQVSADSLTAMITVARRTRSFEHIDQLRALISDTALLTMLTVEGPGTVNINAASLAVLSALPGMTAEAVDVVAYHRSVERAVRNLDALAHALSPASRDVLFAHYAELAGLVTFSAPQLLLTAEGWVGAAAEGPPPLRATIELLVVPTHDRLAVIRRRMW
jgi:type II secretory pathway component PulK